MTRDDLVQRLEAVKHCIYHPHSQAAEDDAERAIDDAIAALAAPPAAPPADLVALKKEIQRWALYCFTRHGDDAYLYNRLAELGGVSPDGRGWCDTAAPRVPDTPQGYTDTRCAACGHDADRHFSGGRCMHVPCMCAEWQPLPAPPREPRP